MSNKPRYKTDPVEWWLAATGFNRVREWQTANPFLGYSVGLVPMAVTGVLSIVGLLVSLALTPIFGVAFFMRVPDDKYNKQDEDKPPTVVEQDSRKVEELIKTITSDLSTSELESLKQQLWDLGDVDADPESESAKLNMRIDNALNKIDELLTKEQIPSKSASPVQTFTGNMWETPKAKDDADSRPDSAASNASTQGDEERSRPDTDSTKLRNK